MGYHWPVGKVSERRSLACLVGACSDGRMSRLVLRHFLSDCCRSMQMTMPTGSSCLTRLWSSTLCRRADLLRCHGASGEISGYLAMMPRDQAKAGSFQHVF